MEYRTKLKFISFLILIILVEIFAWVFRFTQENTAVFTPEIPKGVLAQNNQNKINRNTYLNISDDLFSLSGDLVTLEPKELEIPEWYSNKIFRRGLTLNLPENFEISVFVSGLEKPRAFDFDDNNNLYVALMGTGRVAVVTDSDNNGVADEVREIDSNLRNVHGIDYYKGDLYVGAEDEVVVYKSIQSDGNYEKKKVVVGDLPYGGGGTTIAGHVTRTVKVGPDEKLYVSIGSSCNVCEEEDNRRATVARYNLDGSGGEIFASGLRNTVGLTFHDDKVWGVDNGRDQLGDDTPPEELNIIEYGNNYGWPYCYGNGVSNPEYPDKAEYCEVETKFPFRNMQAHSSPLGIAFLPSDYLSEKMNFPEDLLNEAFITYHGSWNRTIPTGYKVVRVDSSNKDAEPVNFITGWLNEDGEAWGRPVDVNFDNNGIMFVSDDKAGAIYRIKYNHE